MQTTGFSLSNWNIGQKVAGVYCGFPYRGRIVEGRNTPDYRNWILEIDLDAPVEIYGQVRNHVSVWTNTLTCTVEAL